MDTKIVLVVESAVTPGRFEGLKPLIEELSAHCHANEDGLLRYDWFISDDQTVVRVVEEYADSDAIRFHGQNCASFQLALAECRTVQKLEVFGNPDADLRAVFESRGASIYAPI